MTQYRVVEATIIMRANKCAHNISENIIWIHVLPSTKHGQAMKGGSMIYTPKSAWHNAFVVQKVPKRQQWVHVDQWRLRLWVVMVCPHCNCVLEAPVASDERDIAHHCLPDTCYHTPTHARI